METWEIIFIAVLALVFFTVLLVLWLRATKQADYWYNKYIRSEAERSALRDSLKFSRLDVEMLTGEVRYREREINSLRELVKKIQTELHEKKAK